MPNVLDKPLLGQIGPAIAPYVMTESEKNDTTSGRVLIAVLVVIAILASRRK